MLVSNSILSLLGCANEKESEDIQISETFIILIFYIGIPPETPYRADDNFLDSLKFAAGEQRIDYATKYFLKEYGLRPEILKDIEINFKVDFHVIKVLIPSIVGLRILQTNDQLKKLTDKKHVLEKFKNAFKVTDISSPDLDAHTKEELYEKFDGRKTKLIS